MTLQPASVVFVGVVLPRMTEQVVVVPQTPKRYDDVGTETNSGIRVQAFYFAIEILTRTRVLNARSAEVHVRPARSAPVAAFDF